MNTKHYLPPDFEVLDVGDMQLLCNSAIDQLEDFYYDDWNNLLNKA